MALGNAWTPSSAGAYGAALAGTRTLVRVSWIPGR